MFKIIRLNHYRANFHSQIRKMVHYNNQIDKTHFVLPNKQRIEDLKCDGAFKSLTDKEKLYAHYLSQASRYVGLVALTQSSPEAPLIYSLLNRIFRAETLVDLKKHSSEAGVNEVDFTSFLVYSCGFFANAGNYKGMGDTKFIPNLDVDKFETVIESSKAYELNQNTITDLWSKCKKPIYNLTERTKCIGLNDKGITTYFSENCTKEDADRVTAWLQFKKICGYNCRTFKTQIDGYTKYDIKLASVEEGYKDGVTVPPEDYKDYIFTVTRGDYSPIMASIVENLVEAKKYTANDNQTKMIEHFIKSFTEGDINEHKQGSRFWIKDKGPVIETYMGTIAPYRDPSGIRGEFNSFVSLVNKENTVIFTNLVQKAEIFLNLLPWSKDFEKDVYLIPDFTSLEVLAFDGSVVPAGISIPPYEDIRQDEGFKNVSLGNVILAAYNSKENQQFLSDDDQVLMKKYKTRAFEIQVGLHETLGHGSGKLLSLNENGRYNFDNHSVINPLTRQLVDSWYEPGETYVSKFGTIGPSYEECRAEAIALFLSLDREALSIFGITDEQEIEDIVYVNWLSMVWAGVTALELYDPLTKKWMQAHSNARYAIMRALLEAGQDFVSVKETEDGRNLLVQLDRTKINSVGRETIQRLLMKLQIYKSIGDVKSASRMYAHYSEVSNDTEPHTWEKWRDIVLAHKKPRCILVQSNTELRGETVVLKTYETSLEGYLESCVDRFRHNDETSQILQDIWEANKQYYPTLTETSETEN